MKINFDRRKSLQELEGEDWGEPEASNTSLVKTCMWLRRVPLQDFTTENLRIIIDQKISLCFLVPLALETLDQDPLAQGDFYAGDLLSAVLSVPESYWRLHTEQCEVLRRVIVRAKTMLTELDETESNALRNNLKQIPDFLIDS
ncbi:contact-dependent growth inhibition system immunity protein [Gimesia sp.]|uniref:contact-dependent growth inhibition system immunity protein n=1 Tax=Gimesia sp. TaxID=2024833 RepID=UPI0032EAD031